jgi:hypothetical protein
LIQSEASNAARLGRRPAMKKAIKLFLRFMILVGLLFPGSGVGLRVRAQGDSPPGSYIIFYVISALPSKICLRDKLTIAIAYRANYPTATTFAGVTDNTFTYPQPKWDILAGKTRQTMVAYFKATKLGQGFANFGSSAVSDSSEEWNFEVVECDYSILFNANAEEQSEKVRFVVNTGGYGGFSSSDSVGGSGKYSVHIKPTYEDNEGSHDLSCWMTGEVQGESGFEVSGSRTEETVTIDIKFASLTLEGDSKLNCTDANDRSAALGFLSGSSVDPNRDLKLTGIKFSTKVESYKYTFSFGKTGTGSVTVMKREK